MRNVRIRDVTRARIGASSTKEQRQSLPVRA
jgi:hypothetical protein